MCTPRRMLPCLLLPAALLLGAASAPDKPMAELKKEADAVLKLGAVNARAKLDVVFDYARLAAEQGQTQQALKYYEAGLRFHALSYKNQLAYAELLAKQGKTDLAKRRARMVAESTEDDTLVARARKLLGEKGSTAVKPIARPEGKKPVLVLVPMDEVGVLLLREAGQRVRETLGIDVLIRAVPIEMPPPSRRPFAKFVGKLRETLNGIKTKSPEAFAVMLKEEGLAEKDLDDHKNVIRVFLSLVRRSGEKQTRGFQAAVARMRGEEDQWDVAKLVGILRKAVKPYERPGARFLGVTCKDVFDDDYAFLLALRIDEHGVLSFRRYLADFTNEAPDRSRLRKRLSTQIVNCAGHVFGLPRCSDPTCPRAYSHSVAEHDKKSEKLCQTCRRLFDKAFGRKPKGKE